MTLINKLQTVLEMIKFEHSVFALPFALTGALLALRQSNLDFLQTGEKFAWIILAMIAARSAAMTFNRIADAHIDFRNPRTKMRAIPSGTISKSFAWGFTIFSSAVFIFASAMLNSLCLKLAPVALAVIFGYSYAKRFTPLSHLILGLAVGVAPTAAWIAIRGTLDAVILLLTTAVTFWVAGFDIIYSCQDREFDSTEGLYSLPCLLGVKRALWIARLFHLLMVGFLTILIVALKLGFLSMAGIVVVTAFLMYEHSLIKPNDFSRINAAFFTMNGFISLIFFLFWALDVIWIS